MSITGITHSSQTSAKADAMEENHPDPEVPEKAHRRRFSARYKSEVLATYDKLPRDERGAFLRREGLYTSHITEWRRTRDAGAREALAKPSGRAPTDPRDRQLAGLHKENQRLGRELDKARRVIEIQGKLSVLLEELATDSTEHETGETK
jgi:transposase